MRELTQTKDFSRQNPGPLSPYACPLLTLEGGREGEREKG